MTDLIARGGEGAGPDILARIVERRRERVRAEGHELGCAVPKVRTAPLVPFGADPFLITEIKRRSPSRGWIDRDLSASVHAALYRREGSRNKIGRAHV